MSDKTIWLLKIGGAVLLLCAAVLLYMWAFGSKESTPDDLTPSDVIENPADSTEAGGEPGGEVAAPTIEPDPDYEDYEPADDMFNITDSGYVNRVLSYEYNGDGDTISVGVDVQNADAIYLNLICSVATPESKVGFYFDAGGLMVQYSDTDYQGINDAKNSGESNVIMDKMNGRDYELMTPASFRDESRYGAKWQGSVNEDTTIYFRAVRLNDGVILAIFRLDIKYNAEKNAYEIVSLYSADVTATGELTESDREFIVTDAIDFMTTGRGPNVGLATTDWE